jgi:hypothetical protein
MVCGDVMGIFDLFFVAVLLQCARGFFRLCFNGRLLMGRVILLKI